MPGLWLLAKRHVPEQQTGAAGKLQSCYGFPAAELQGSHRLFEVRDAAQPIQVMSHDCMAQGHDRYMHLVLYNSKLCGLEGVGH